ncbi:MAG TPA: hypothetical protein VKA06_07855, partial [Spirochaetia bacterium]|nr:hypothetical protein [Spirochaetia bacterium]
MSRWRTALRWATLVPLLVLAGCATQPGISRRPAPDWVVQPPAASGGNEFFVATGSDLSGDVEAAEAQAAGSLLLQINQALGVDVTVLTTAEARSTLDSYEASVLQQVTQSGSGRVEGLRIADRYIDERDGRVTVHLLGEYERTAFLAERAERRALLASREELLLAPEREADTAAASGRTGGAILGYLQAADAAARAEDGLRIAPVVLERSLQKAVSLAEGLSIEAVSGPGQTRVGTSPTEPLRFAVRDAEGRPVDGLAVEISYAEPAGRTTVIRRASRVTDDEGAVSFSFPIVEQAGRVEVTAR